MCEQQRRRSACADAVARFFSTKTRLTNLNGEQNDTWNLLVSHRICHFKAIQPFDIIRFAHMQSYKTLFGRAHVFFSLIYNI